MAKLTKLAVEALQKLVALQDQNGGAFPITEGKPYEGQRVTYIATGLNTQTLRGLLRNGYIKVHRLYLGGKVQGLEILKREP